MRRMNLLSTREHAPLFTVALFAVVFMGLAFADVPHLISYQGRLTDGAGTPITGSQNITFRLYDNAVGGTLMWTEAHAGVSLNADGLYNIMLGSITSFPPTLTFEEPYWLAVEHPPGSEICRYELGASPYALNIADTIRKSAIQVFDTDLKVNGGFIYFSEPDNAFITYYGPDETIDVSTHFAPWLNSTYDLGISSYRWRNLYLDGKLYVDDSSPADHVLGTDGSGDLAYLPIGGGADNDWAAVGGGDPTLVGDIYHTGDVGIGTNSPTHNLEVLGTSQVPIYATTSNGIYASIYINGTSAGADVGYGYSRSGALKARSYVNPSNDWILKVGTHDNAIVVDAGTGNVGIGTTSPVGLLDIEGTTGDGRGLYIHDASGIGDPDTGIVIRDVGHHGIYIDSVGYGGGSPDGIYINKPNDNGISIIAPGDDGVYIWQPDDDGVYVTGAGDDGVYIAGTGDDGVYIYNTGGDGVEICGGTNTERGIYIHNALGIGDPDTGIVIRDVGHYGIYIDSVGYDGFDQDGIYIRRPSSNGVSVAYPGGHGFYANEPTVDGMFIYRPGDDGVAVSLPGDNCFECDGSPVALFRVTNQCEVFSHSYNQYIVDENGQGITTPISASTGRWLEHIGEAQLIDGECRVELPKEFLLSVTIDNENPMQVSITPYSNIGNYWVERKEKYFIVHTENDGYLMYKIHAKIKGFENTEIEPVDLNELKDEDN